MARTDLSRAKALYPSCALEGDVTPLWRSFFATSAGEAAVGSLLYSMVDELLSITEREQGVRRVGRRARRASMPLATVERLVFPGAYSTEPFAVAARYLIADRSQGQIVMGMAMSQATLSRLLNGTMPLTLGHMEILSARLGVKPWYFAEYRALFIARLIQELLAGSPSTSIDFMKRIRAAKDALEAAE